MEEDGTAKKRKSLTDGISKTPKPEKDESQPSAEELLYGIEDYPPWHICAFLAFQVG